MKKEFLLGIIAVTLLATIGTVMAAGNGFDQFGYNYQARVFQGKADGVDRVLDGKVWGDPTYAKDNLVMKWSKGWDDARFHGASWTCDAWEDNEWNGMVPGGSQTTEHYKIIWVGPEKWDVTGDWNFDFKLGESDYLHKMTITLFDQSTGAFSGTGVYVPDSSYTWIVNGVVSGDTVSFTIVYDSTSPNPGYTVTGTGTITSATSMSGIATGPGQDFTFSATGQATTYNGPCWREGGYYVWGQFEVIMDQGTDTTGHIWYTHAIPTGYGA